MDKQRLRLASNTNNVTCDYDVYQSQLRKRLVRFQHFVNVEVALSCFLLDYFFQPKIQLDYKLIVDQAIYSTPY